MSAFKELVGKTVMGYSLSANKTSLTFMLEDTELVYDAEGSCCSSSWFEDVSGSLRGTITRVVEREMPDETWNKNETERTQYYGWTLETDKGDRFDIEMRNSDNGYYGGYVTLRGAQ